jgi:hypothetical protein
LIVAFGWVFLFKYLKVHGITNPKISEKVIQDIILVGSLSFHATITLEKVQFLGK